MAKPKRPIIGAGSPTNGGAARASMITVVIPAYNEEAALPATLDRLFAQAGAFRTVVVDGGSSDRTCTVAAAYPGVQVIKARKGRASQMNAGAAQAGDEWLLFLHADTLLPAGALSAIASLGPEVRAGGFRHRFSGTDWRLRLISVLDNLRTRSTRVIYGDQAMFVRRRLFVELGGFPEQPSLEDVAFCRRLRRRTRPVILQQAVVTDARKFVQMGIWRSFARVLLILLCVTLHLPLPRMARRFFRDVR